MAVVTVRYWAGAKRAAGVDQEVLAATSVAQLRGVLAARPALTALSTVASFLVDGEQTGDHETLPDDAVVDVLPPFAGG